MEETFVAEKRKIRFLRTNILLYVLMLVVTSFSFFIIAEKYAVFNLTIIQNTLITKRDIQFCMDFAKTCTIAFDIICIAILLKMQFFSVFDLAKIGEDKSATVLILFDNPDDFYSSVRSNNKRIKLAETIALCLSTQKAEEMLELIYPCIEIVYFFSYIALFTVTSNSAFIFVGLAATIIVYLIYSKLCCVYADSQIDKTLETLSNISINFIEERRKDVVKK